MILHRSLPFLVLSLVVGCIAATSSETPLTDSTAASTGSTQQTGLKPPSELALLMREMVLFSDSTKARLKRGDALLPFPEKFAAMHTATPTDAEMEMDSAMYHSFADHYLRQVRSLYDAATADRDRAFNGTLSACGNCHTVVCPGPMARIKKMYLPLEVK